MTTTEFELVGAIYGLYLYECIHWLKPSTVAFTRSSATTWQPWKHAVTSFSLLGFRPCLANPVPWHAGFVSFQSHELSDKNAKAILRKIDRRPPRTLKLAASVEAAIMLVIVPAATAAELLRHLWRPMLVLVVVSHLTTVWLFSRNIQFWVKDRQKYLKDLLSVCANPLAAIRSGDLLTQRTFEALQIRNPKINSCDDSNLDVSLTSR